MKPGRFRGECSFSPTEMKNYPIQGFATGDIVPEVLGQLYRHLKQTGYDKNIKLVNTVHDSIVLDVASEYVKPASIVLQNVMENAGMYMRKRFGIDIDLEFKADVSVGKNWLECKGK